MKKILLMLSIVGCILSCADNNMIAFDKEESYIYWAQPNPSNRTTEKYIDSIYYSFALDEDLQRQEKTIAIPVNIGGQAIDVDREYSYVLEDSSRYDTHIVSFGKSIVRSGRYSDTLYLTVQRDADLLKEAAILHLTLQANDKFKLGNFYNRKMKVVVDDILTEPKWWNTWKNYFGPFQKEKLQAWMRIYKLGVDPSPELGSAVPGPFYYWNNMPTSAYASWYPVTFNYVAVLKQYFQDNVIYPNGDTTQERILLP